jgi:hypothetical protein
MPAIKNLTTQTFYLNAVVGGQLVKAFIRPSQETQVTSQELEMFLTASNTKGYFEGDSPRFEAVGRKPQPKVKAKPAPKKPIDPITG